MFNGIIFNTGKVKLIKKKNKSITLVIKTNLNLNKKDLGSSICCNGVCLTLTKISGKLIYFYLSDETLKRSNFKNIKKDQLVNLEKSLIYGQKLSGHFIQGHVDTTAKVKKISIIDNSWVLRLEFKNKKFMKYLE